MRLFEGWHIVVLLVVVLLIFGASRLPQVAKSVGQSAKILKKEMRDLQDDSSGTNDANAPKDESQSTGDTGTKA